VSQAPAASLHTGLLAAKGSAQPSRGVNHPLIERLATASAAPTAPGPTMLNAPRAPTSAAPHRLSVRVDDRMQLRLRLASAHLGRNRQIILLEALDHYLNQVMPTYLHERCPCIEGGDGESGRCHQDKT
jgi:predicted DNA-binding protein